MLSGESFSTEFGLAWLRQSLALATGAGLQISTSSRTLTAAAVVAVTSSDVLVCSLYVREEELCH